MLLQIIKKLLNSIVFPLTRTIVFESNPEMTGNVGAVYNELLKRGLNKKYKFVWRVEDRKKYADCGVENVYFIDYAPKEIGQKIRWLFYRWTAKALIFENRFSEKKWKNQLAINLMHGMTIKSNGYYVEHDTCDYIVTSGCRLNDVIAREYDVPIEKVVSLGYPRTDVLNKKTGSFEKLNIPNNKVIVWMPTFRKNRNIGDDEGKQYPSGIPLLTDGDKFDKLNTCLKENDCILIIKLHPEQDTSGMANIDHSNILFLSDKAIEDKGTSAYELLAESSALLTDYSSVYYDCLLSDNPIGLVIDDIEEYEKKRGMAFDYKSYIKGDYIYSLDELMKFISDVAAENDPAEETRIWAKRNWCDYTDFKSTERVTEFILDRL